jgi:predicted permease
VSAETGPLLRLLLAIISAPRWLAPASRRRDWHRQWRADIWHEWRWLNRRGQPVTGRVTLVGRTAGAVRHAFWLRGHVRRIEMLSQDLRYGWRSLVRKPAFALVTILTLGVGIGANTTIFSVLNAVLLRPLAFSDPDRVVRVTGRTASGAPISRFSFPDFADYRTRSRTLADLNGANLGTFILGVDNRTDQILGEIVSGRYLSMLGVTVPVGRTLGDADDRVGAAPVAVVSDALWQQRFAREPIVGRSVLLNGRSYAIVGVATPAFSGSFVGAPIDVWIPIGSSGNALGPDWNVNRSRRTLALIGRLAPGVTRGQAQAELQIIADDLSREFTAEPRLKSVDVQPGTLAAGDQRRLARTFLSLLLGLVGLVLLIACANVGNLLLARVLGRRRELAIRVALGASRAQIARMLVTESLLVAGAGGSAALLLSLWTTRAFAGITPLPTLSLRLDVHPDARVLGFTILITLAAAVMLAVVGAFQAIKPDITPALREDAASSIGGRSPARLRGTLATLQITVSLLLLIGAALFVRSVGQAAAIDLGFDTRNVLVMDIEGAGGRTAGAIQPFFRDVLQRVSAVPGVEAAALSTRAPLDSSTPMLRVNALEAVSAGSEVGSTAASLLIVTPQYLDVVKTPLVAGRGFTGHDDAIRPAVAIVNETLAARLWPGGDAIGRRLWLDPLVTGAPGHRRRHRAQQQVRDARRRAPGARLPVVRAASAAWHGAAGSVA